MTAVAQERWLPIEFSIASGTISVNWMDFGTKFFTEPFFKQTLFALKTMSPPAAERTTDVSLLIEEAGRFVPVKPSGVIFHVSRCGSTLLTNVLRTGTDVVALSEPGPVEYLLDHNTFRGSTLSEVETNHARRLLLDSTTTLYAHFAKQRGHKLIVKCCHSTITQLSLARSIWPDVPFVVLIRDPLEVIVSNLRKPAYWLKSKHRRMRDGRIFGLSTDQVMTMSAEEYCARVLSCLYKAAAAQIDNMCWLIDYADMNIDSYYKIASLFGIRMPECGSKELQEALSTYSKDISRTHEFQSDHELKQHRATELIRQFDEMFTRDHYAKLRGAMRDLIHIEPRIT